MSKTDTGGVAVEGLPGSAGEHGLQDRFGTLRRARKFYGKQVLDHLNESMREFVATQEMVFVATADARGEADCTFRSGPPGFVRVLGERTVAYPEYRGNGVMASLGNISENPHVGMMFVDFLGSTVGLHVNGKAKIVENDEMAGNLELPEEAREYIANETGGRKPERWVLVEVEEAYIHCAKHVPLMGKLDKKIHWGTDDERRKGGDYFRAKSSPSPWSEQEGEKEAPEQPSPGILAGLRRLVSGKSG